MAGLPSSPSRERMPRHWVVWVVFISALAPAVGLSIIAQSKQWVQLVESGQYRTYYAHKSLFDHSARIIRTDCSGFVNAVVNASIPEAFSELEYIIHAHSKVIGGRYPAVIKRPLAVHYSRFGFLLQSNAVRAAHWRVLRTFTELRPGDLIILNYWDLSLEVSRSGKDANTKRGKNSGHIMVLQNHPTCDPEETRLCTRSKKAESDEVSLAHSRPYGCNGSRNRSEEVHRLDVIDSRGSLDLERQGLRHRPFYLIVASGLVMGFKWRLNQRTALRSPISFLRVVP